MEQLIKLLYGIPVLGLVFQFVGYLIDDPARHRADHAAGGDARSPSAALCGVLCERSGVVNIGIEGIMLVGGFVGWMVGVSFAPSLGDAAAPIFGITPALLIALVAALARGHADLAASTPGCRSASGRTRSSAARSSTSPRSG